MAWLLVLKDESAYERNVIGQMCMEVLGLI